MKKLLTIALLFVAATTFAQKGSAVKLPLAVGDTVRSSGTVSKYLSLTGGYSGTAIQINGHKIGGTPGGTVKVYGSLDGITYNQIGKIDTIVNTTDQAFLHYIAAPLPSHIKILATGSGTDTTAISVWYRTPIFQHN